MISMSSAFCHDSCKKEDSHDGEKQEEGSSDPSTLLKKYIHRCKLNNGRPKIVIDEDLLVYLRQLGHKWSKIGSLLNIDERTLRRRRMEMKFVDPQTKSNLSDSELDQQVRDILQSDASIGSIRVQKQLHNNNVFVIRSRIRDSLRRVKLALQNETTHHQHDEGISQ